MSRPKSRLLVLLAALLIGTGVALVPAGPALAAGCSATGCNGKDPMAQGRSSDATTIDEFSYGDVRFELRHSSACVAVWTRVTSGHNYNTIFGQIRGYTSYPSSLSSPTARIEGVQALQGQQWTRMVSYSYWVRSCRAVWFDATPPVECTPVH